MVIREQACADAQAVLQCAQIENAFYEARWLCDAVCGRAAALTDEQYQKLLALARRRAEHYPLQYLLGEWDFMDFALRVGEGVLIPRPDTECVCEAAARKIADMPAPRVADLCSGSGAVGIAVKRLVPGAQVTCVELSEQALAYLRRNAQPYAQVQQADVFAWQNTQPDESWDLFVSNPPYLAAAEMDGLQPEVRCEPRMALLAEQNGLAFYAHFARCYRSKLAHGGWFVAEIGYKQAQSVHELFEQNNWSNIEILQDYAGNDRVICAQKL